MKFKIIDSIMRRYASKSQATFVSFKRVKTVMGKSINQEYMNSETSWQCFCMIKSQNGHSYSEMNIDLPSLLT